MLVHLVNLELSLQKIADRNFFNYYYRQAHFRAIEARAAYETFIANKNEKKLAAAFRKNFEKPAPLDELKTIAKKLQITRQSPKPLNYQLAPAARAIEEYLSLAETL